MVDLEESALNSEKNAEVLMKNMRRFSEVLGEISQFSSDMMVKGDHDMRPPFQLHEMFHTLTTLGVSMAANPQKSIANQQALIRSVMDISSKHLNGFVSDTSQSDSTKDSEIDNAPLFGFMSEAYEAVSHWVHEQVESLDNLDEHSRLKGRFYTRQLMDALSPRNFLFSNPDLLRVTIAENGANLVRGIEMYRDDLIAGRGFIKIRQTDVDHFRLGENIAATKGKVVFRNEMMELIQYQPTTKKVYARPILIVPPWINKYYVLDLSPQKSMVKWLVDQGHTVFIISWVNPSKQHRHKGWAAYLHEGPLAALDVIETMTGAKKINTVGYCVGGTLLSIACAYLGARADKRVGSMTLLTTQVDFELAGDLLVFIDDRQIGAMEAEMVETGYLASSRMSMTFNLLRSSDLIWAYVINNYLRGQKPRPFDLLYWNSDSTRMTEANHRFYLRGLYKDNLLAQKAMMIDGMTIDLGQIKAPVFNMAAREDHIAPAVSVFKGQQNFGGEVTFVVGGGGHIAGVINPPHKKKYYHLVGGGAYDDYGSWIERAERIEGSWWITWLDWLRAQDGRLRAAKAVGSDDFPPLHDAPGTYAKMV